MRSVSLRVCIDKAFDKIVSVLGYLICNFILLKTFSILVLNQSAEPNRSCLAEYCRVLKLGNRIEARKAVGKFIVRVEGRITS